jgi:hypothetical protein
MSVDLRKPKGYRKASIQDPLPWMLETTEKFHIHVCLYCRLPKYCDGPVSRCQLPCIPFFCGDCQDELNNQAEAM